MRFLTLIFILYYLVFTNSALSETDGYNLKNFAVTTYDNVEETILPPNKLPKCLEAKKVWDNCWGIREVKLDSINKINNEIFQLSVSVKSELDMPSFEGEWKNNKIGRLGHFRYRSEYITTYFDKFLQDYQKFDKPWVKETIIVYSGYFKDEQFHGKGTLRLLRKKGREGKYVDQVGYKGEFRKGNMEGRGVMIVTRTHLERLKPRDTWYKYDGEFKNNMFEGKGEYSYCDDGCLTISGDFHKSSTKGKIVNDLYVYEGQLGFYPYYHIYGVHPDGEGKACINKYRTKLKKDKSFNNPFCDKFSGNWSPGGVKGEYNFFNGDTYIGEMAKTYEGKFFPHGKGKKVYKFESAIYEGDWARGKYEGSGTFKSGKEIYEGMWYQGLRDGYGTQAYSDGESYQGYWLKGKRHGQGLLICPNGEENKGSWKNDEYYPELSWNKKLWDKERVSKNVCSDEGSS